MAALQGRARGGSMVEKQRRRSVRARAPWHCGHPRVKHGGHSVWTPPKGASVAAEESATQAADEFAADGFYAGDAFCRDE